MMSAVFAGSEVVRRWTPLPRVTRILGKLASQLMGVLHVFLLVYDYNEDAAANNVPRPDDRDGGFLHHADPSTELNVGQRSRHVHGRGRQRLRLPHRASALQRLHAVGVVGPGEFFGPEATYRSLM